VIKYLVVHVSGSPPGRGDDAATIHRWHKERGWDGIGYNAVITESGEWQAGRPDYWPGAHVRDFDGDGEGNNDDSLGVCLIGLSGDASDRQLVTLRALLETWLMKHPAAKVVGHCDLDSRKPDCPGFDVGAWFYNEDV